MNDKLQELKSLLQQGIITKDEYKMIENRLKEPKDVSEYTWDDIVNGYYNYCSDKYTQTTSKGYKTCIMKYAMYITKTDNYEESLEKPFHVFTFQNINKFVEWMHEDGLGNQTINKIKYALIVLCDYLNSLGIKTPDITPITIPEETSVKQHVPVIREDEIFEVAYTTDLRSRICIRLCYEAALKRNELTRVRFEDLAHRNNQLFIYDDDGRFTRSAVLSDELIAMIKEYKRELYADVDKWNKSRLKKGKELREDYGYIFQNIKAVVPSYPMLQTLLKNAVKRYYENNQNLSDEEAKEKINAFTFETLRNSRRLYLLAKGNTVQEVMDIIGDKNYMTTYRFKKYIPVVYPDLYAANTRSNS